MRKFRFPVLALFLVTVLASCVVAADAPSGQNPMQNAAQEMQGEAPTPPPEPTPRPTSVLDSSVW